MRRGLNRDAVINEAVKFIELSGYEMFSMHSLAQKLHIKTASLYAHVKNLDELLSEAGKRILEIQKDYEMKAIEGKSKDEAIYALAIAYRSFAKEHKEFYDFIMSMITSRNEKLIDEARIVVEPFMDALSLYDIDYERKLHWQRVLRGMMHGFVSQEECGYFSHYDLDVDQSYQLAIECLIHGLNKEEGEKNG